MGLELFPGEFESFRRIFSRCTGTQWVCGRRIQLPDNRGWLASMTVVASTADPDWWMITNDPGVTPQNVPGVAVNPSAPSVFIVRWGAAHLRVWRCHVYEDQIFPKPTGTRAHFPNAIIRPVNKQRNGPWGNELWVVQ